VILVLPDRNTEIGHLSQAWGLLYFAFLEMFFTWRNILDVIMPIYIFFFCYLFSQLLSIKVYNSSQIPFCCSGFYILPVLQKYFHISSKISAAMYDHPLSLLKNKNPCMHQNSTVCVVHYPVLHFCFYVRPSALCLWNEHLFTSNFLKSSSSLPQEVPVETCKILWDSWHFVWSC